MCLLFLLILSALRAAFSDDGAALQVVEGRVGGSVLLRCNVSDSPPVKGIYFQKDNKEDDNKKERIIFVNGFYTKKPDISPEYINRTSVNRSDKSLKMWNLKVSDEGEYFCAVMSEPESYTATKFNLTIKAPFSIPTVTIKSRSDGGDGTESWALQCLSSGGYPPDVLNWTVFGKENSVLLQEGVSESYADEHSGVWTINQTATFNCTHPANITCSVGGATSPPFSICTDTPSSPEYTVIIAVVLLFLFILVVVIILIRVCQRQQRPEVELATVETDQLNHSPLLDQAG
ncbi:T-lymphocyte activation antigen CD80 isoform X2 [Astyanax mexicanus]|uniref:T-lymphocyte activation antigen CD80 isoform X2 n=1 Tax=Astyanax mexicanus TaxID=7994 RepID=UPI0020CB348F|nr:T-lymphocyte activation antigen CD80 isoform X2 [Astyanax mexicanus]